MPARIEDIKDEVGNIVGFEMFDEDGARIGGSTGQGDAPLPGFNPPVDPNLPVFPKTSRRSGQGSVGADGLYVPPNLLGGSESPTEASEGVEGVEGTLTPEDEQGAGIGPAFPGRGTVANINRLQAEQQSRQGGLRGLAGRARLLRQNLNYGAVDAIDDTFDFGAAVLDKLRGQDVNDADNVFNIRNLVSRPTSTAGQVTADLTSFGIGSLVPGAIVGKGARAIPVFARIAKAAPSLSQIGSGAATGFLTDFTKAKQGEQNLYNTVAGTPLETPMSRFFAADTDEESNLWMNKLKEGLGGIPLGIGFDLLGEGVGQALSRFKTEPAEAYVRSVKKARGLPEAEQPIALLQAADATEQIMKERAEELKNVIDVEAQTIIADAKKMIEGSLDGTEEAGFINADLLGFQESEGISGLRRPREVPRLTPGTRFNADDAEVAFERNMRRRVTQVELIEEQLAQLDEIRVGLYGLGEPEITSGSLEELDRSIFEIEDELDNIIGEARREAADRIQQRQSIDTIDQDIAQAQADVDSPAPLRLEEVEARYARGIQEDFDEFERLGGFGFDPEDSQTIRFEDEFGYEPEIVEPGGEPTDKTQYYLERVEADPEATAVTDARSRALRLRPPTERPNTLSALEQQRDELVGGVLPDAQPTPRSNVIPAPEPETRAVLQRDTGEPFQRSVRPPEAPPNAVGTTERVGRTPLEPTPTRAPQTPPNAAGTVEQTTNFRQLDAPAPESTRARNPQPYSVTPNNITAERIQRVTPDEEVAGIFRNRSKPEIRKDVAVKKVRRAAAKKATEPVVNQKNIKSNVEYLKNNDFSDPWSDDPNPDRFINVDRLTRSEEIKQAHQFVMDSLDAKDIVESRTQGAVVREAAKLREHLGNLEPDEADALFIAYAGNVANQPVAETTARLILMDIGNQLQDKLAAVTTDKAFTDMTIGEIANQVNLFDHISKYKRYMMYNKNLGKLAAQSLNIRNVDLSDAKIQNMILKADFDAMHAQVDEGLRTADEIFGDIQEALNTPDGREKLQKMVVGMKSAKDLDGIVSSMDAGMFSIRGLIKEAPNFLSAVRINSILSGTSTNLTNLVSNAAMTAYVPMTQIAGASLDAAYHTLRGNGEAVIADRKAATEAIASLQSVTHYLKDSMAAAAASFRAGKNIISESSITKELSPLDLQNPTTPSNAINQGLRALGIPVRLLTAGDELFKQLNYRSNVYGKAYASGLDQGLKGNKLHKYAARMVEDSLAVNAETGIKGLALDSESLEYADFATFQTELSEDNSVLRKGLIDVIDRMKQNPIPGVSQLTSLFVPFIRTPANVMAYSIRNTPLAAVSKGWRADIAAGGARAARAKGEFAVGSLALSGAIGLALQGKLTGAGPRNKGERQLWFEQGNKPYSIKFPGSHKSISFQRMEPFATHLGIVADIAEAVGRVSKKDQDEFENNVMGAATLAFVSSFKNRTFFEGFSQLIELVNSIDSEDTFTRRVANMRDQILPTLIPYSSLGNEIRRKQDPVLRETEGIVDAFKNKLPGLGSEDLPPRRSWLTGDVITLDANPLLNIYPHSNMNDDPVIKNLLKFNVAITPPSKTIKGVEMTNEEYSQFLEVTGTIEIGGKTLHAALGEVFDNHSPEQMQARLAELEYIQKNDEYAQKTSLAVELKAVRSRYNKAAQALMVTLNPELLQRIRVEMNNKGNVDADLWFLNEPLGGLDYLQDPTVREARQGVVEDVEDDIQSLVEGAGPFQTQRK